VKLAESLLGICLPASLLAYRRVEDRENAVISRKIKDLIAIN